MEVLLTGGRGFVGRNLFGALRSAGLSVKLFEGDLRDRERVLSLAQSDKIDCIIHLAGLVSGKNTSDFRSVNVEGTKNIADLSRRLGAKLIFLSSLKVIFSFDDPYVRSKREAERILAETVGLRYIILRPSMIYGPGDKKNIGQLIRLAKIFRALPAFNFRLQLIFIDDLVKAIVASLSLEPNRVVDLGGQIIGFGDFLKLLQAGGLNFSIVRWPGFFAALVRFFSVLPLSPFPAWQVRSLMADEVADDRIWAGLLKIEQTPLEAGVKRILRENQN